MNPLIYLSDDEIIQPVPLDPENRTAVMGWRGKTSPDLVRPKMSLPIDQNSPEIYGFTATDQCIAWEVIVDEPGHYLAGVIYVTLSTRQEAGSGIGTGYTSKNRSVGLGSIATPFNETSAFLSPACTLVPSISRVE